MEKPEYAPNSFGEIMKCCWQADPNERPNFNQLEEMITNHLESQVSSYYCNLNDSYEKLNEEKDNASSFGLTKLLETKTKLTKSKSMHSERNKKDELKGINKFFSLHTRSVKR